jgi:hypothetical protein
VSDHRDVAAAAVRGRPARHLHVALLAGILALSLAQPAHAGITSPKDGWTYVIPENGVYATARLDWHYPLPDPRCTGNYAGVTYYETTPGLGEGPNGGGTQDGPFSEATLEWAIPGAYRGRTTWTCTIDAPPLGHPAGDYNVFDQPLETIAYNVRLYGNEVPPDQGVRLASQRQLTYKESVLRLVCLKTDQDCYARGRVILDAVQKVLKVGSAHKSSAKRVVIGTARYSVAGGSGTTVHVPLQRRARKAFKRRGSLKVRVTVRASVEGGPARTKRKNAKLKLAHH